MKSMSNFCSEKLTACKKLYALLACGLAFLLVWTQGVQAIEATEAVSIIKSKNDQREYRYTVLSNQLRVLLISDPGADKAAAALDVYAGSGDDPKDREGLAHFLEHMLFLGTKQYPEPGEYQTFISNHGGSHNAYTSLEHTNYFFDVEAAHLEAALDRFAPFFTSPLFTEKYVERERNAVNSEYQAKIKDDFRRTLDAYRQILNPQHPMAKFSVGSLTTLADRKQQAVRDDLLAFYHTYYSADNMALVVLGREPLAQLESMVTKRFAGIPLQKESPHRMAQPLFQKGFLPATLYVKPEKDIRRLSFTFPLPAVRADYAKKPLEYLGNILGHEGKGSLFSLLKQKGWAEALSAGEGFSDRFGSVFNVSISLTPDGLSHRQDIEALVFEMINLVARKGVSQWRFEEQQKLARIAFRFQEKRAPIHTVSMLASSMQNYKPEDILRGGYLFAQYDEKLIRHLLSYLTPENVLVTVTAHSVKTDKITEKYQVPYRVEHGNAVQKAPVTAAVKSDSKKYLDLPDKNRFIPDDLDLSKQAREIAAVPQLVKETKRFRAYFLQDTHFGVPKANIYLRIKSPHTAENATTAAVNEIYVAMVNDALNEFAYPASLAGLQFSVLANSRGLDVQIGGYHDRQKVLLDRILKTLIKPDFSASRFENIRQELIRNWKNLHKQSPYQQLLREMPAAVFQPYWDRDILIEELEAVSLKQIRQYAKTLFKDSQADMLIFGNYRERDAVRLAKRAEGKISRKSRKPQEIQPAKVVKLDQKGEGLYTHLPTDHQDTAVTLYAQGKTDSLDDMAHMLLLQQTLRSPFFHVLRTEKQLGYIVFATSMSFKDVPGIVLVVQSPVASQAQIRNEINTFIRSQFEQLPESLAQQKQAVISRLTEQPKNLHEQAERYWDDIVRNALTFDRREKLAEAIKGISRESFVEYYRSVLLNDANQWWWIADSKGTVLKGKQSVNDYEAFKSAQPGYRYP